ncbi:Bdr family repetitive protein [Candidatus Borreliella tachyglossi]|uniref:Bdr family repetitive protein n=1 Tax=Candidatus Borreliella tachyglossi TaxID=1964448 RepID=UPI00404217AD
MEQAQTQVQEVAKEVASMFYHNEITYKDLESLEKNFSVSLKALESRVIGVENRLNDLREEIKSIKEEIRGAKTELKGDIAKLDSKIDGAKTELKGDINNKIDIKVSGLDNKIDTKFSELKSEIAIVNIRIDNVEKNTKWIFGLTFALWLTVIGGFITLFIK